MNAHDMATAWAFIIGGGLGMMLLGAYFVALWLVCDNSMEGGR